MSEQKRNAMPWDLLNPNTKYVPESIYSWRYETCKSCEFFTAARTCSKCNCFMKVKCALGHAYCPEGKWGTYDMELEGKK